MQKDVPLAQYTTIEIGGPARFFVEARSEDEIIGALRWANEAGVPVFTLGGGSNILFGDDGFNGLVVKISTSGVVFEELDSSTVAVTSAAGEEWDGLVSMCSERGLAGIECLSGIPGTVGGTPIQNVGAYGQEVSQTIVSVRCLDRETLRVVEIENADCGFSYRQSIFNTIALRKYVVLSLRFRLRSGRPELPEYPELRREIEASINEMTPLMLREAVMRLRRRKSMVVDPSDPNSRSLGSFFKNPVVSLEDHKRLCDRFGDVPSFVAEGGVKVPAAWLIEKSGFTKGHVEGNTGISTKHSLALINRGGATAAELIAFRDKVAAAVEQRFGIRLFMEPEAVGA